MNYLYNGIALPALPEWDKEAYPYAMIGYPEGYGPFPYFFCAKEEPFKANSTRAAYFLVNMPVCYWVTSDTPNEWADVNLSPNRNVTFIWANHDVYAYDVENTIVIPASDPVPVTPLDQTALFTGWLAGKHVAGQRRRAEPVAYLYNGVRLPKLPELPYEYAVIEYADADALVKDGRLARLICSSEPITYTLGGMIPSKYNLVGDVRYFGFATHDAVWRFSFSMDAPYPPTNEWVQIGEAHFDEPTSVLQVVTASNAIWANHDLKLSNNGNVWVSVSEPVPVYE